MKRGTALIVFSRDPSPGRAKTRLAPRLGDWRAARLQARMTLCALRTARQATRGPVELHCWPRMRSAFFVFCKRKLRVSLKAQRGADLGARMYRALSRALRRHRTAILIGADCPALGAQDLRRAARMLCGGRDVVLAPTEDGGYALIGARRVSRALFEGVSWGSSQVYRETALRLSALRYRWRALRTLWDLDRPGDLDRLRALRFRAANLQCARR